MKYLESQVIRPKLQEPSYRSPYRIPRHSCWPVFQAFAAISPILGEVAYLQHCWLGELWLPKKGTTLKQSVLQICGQTGGFFMGQHIWVGIIPVLWWSVMSYFSWFSGEPAAMLHRLDTEMVQVGPLVFWFGQDAFHREAGAEFGWMTSADMSYFIIFQLGGYQDKNLRSMG